MAGVEAFVVELLAQLLALEMLSGAVARAHQLYLQRVLLLLLLQMVEVLYMALVVVVLAHLVTPKGAVLLIHLPLLLVVYLVAIP